MHAIVLLEQVPVHVESIWVTPCITVMQLLALRYLFQLSIALLFNKIYVVTCGLGLFLLVRKFVVTVLVKFISMVQVIERYYQPTQGQRLS